MLSKQKLFLIKFDKNLSIVHNYNEENTPFFTI